MDISEMEKNFVAPTYDRESLELVEGEGMKVEDSDGNEYLDFVGGIAVCALGHSHPAVSGAIREQGRKLMHVSNLYYIPNQMRLAKKLSEVTPKGIRKFFFCNSGTEAVESALKLAVKHTENKKILALEGSFHGRTSASLGLTWEEKYREPFSSLISPNFDFIPRNDLEAARESIDEDTAAIIVEPIQGETGINPMTKGFLAGLRTICDEEDCLLIFDEVQTGIGRTGNGFPIGCMGAKKEIMDSFSPGDHASTFGGNPLACAVGKTVLETIERKDILSNVKRVGEHFKEGLRKLEKSYDIIRDV
ncbi:MAG: aspartate aminotransferase family protein, partial [Candidatus Aenigmatarchaeota archaeon]